MESVNIFDYHDYREFLRDFYSLKKERNKKYSFRVFSQRAGLSSPTHLRAVIKKERGIGPRTITKFIKGLDLKKNERSYFEALVQFEQSKGFNEKRDTLKRLQRLRRGQSLPVKEFHLYSEWYYPLLYELILTDDFCEDETWLELSFKGRIQGSSLKKAIEEMLDSGSLIRDDQGQLHQHATINKSKDEIEDLLIRDFQKTMLETAEKHFEDAIEEREFQSLTIATSSNDFAEIKQRIKAFVEEINREFSLGAEKTEVSQMNIQLFKALRPAQQSLVDAKQR